MSGANQPSSERAGGPRLSVIVPVYNGTSDLARCLAALRASALEHFEVIVVDDGSTEPVEPLAAEHGCRYLRIEGPGGPARARNRGVEIAGGDIVVFIDADVCVKPDTLSRFAAAFAEDARLAAVIGSYDDQPARKDFLSQYKNLFHHYVHQRSHGEAHTFWSGCGAMRRDLFLAFGGFDERRYRRPAIEDIELGTWVAAAGHAMRLDGRITATHLKRWTFGKLLRTDVLDRGVPWVRLMMRAGTAARRLNVTPGQRLSVALCYLTLLMLAAGWWWAPAWGGAALAAAGVMAINRGLYRFFAARRGFWFALRAVPLHWLYFLYCGLSVALGLWLYVVVDRAELSAARAQRPLS